MCRRGGRAATRPPPPLPGRKLPAATRLRLDHPRAVAAGFVGSAVARAAVGDQNLDRHPGLVEPGDAGRQAGEGRAEHLGGVEGRNYDADGSRHGPDDGRPPP